jgi:hypothetical protein
VSWTDIAFGVAGCLVYLPVLSFGAMLLVLAIRHVFFAKSLDADAHPGDNAPSFFVRHWNESLSPRERVFANLAMIAVLFLGVCWIAAAIAGK